MHHREKEKQKEWSLVSNSDFFITVKQGNLLLSPLLIMDGLSGTLQSMQFPSTFGSLVNNDGFS